jgi:hypothetical protein
MLTLFNPPIELASRGPGGHLYVHRRVNFAAVYLGNLLQVGVAEIHI